MVHRTIATATATATATNADNNNDADSDDSFPSFYSSSSTSSKHLFFSMRMQQLQRRIEQAEGRTSQETESAMTMTIGSAMRDYGLRYWNEAWNIWQELFFEHLPHDGVEDDADDEEQEDMFLLRRRLFHEYQEELHLEEITTYQQQRQEKGEDLRKLNPAFYILSGMAHALYKLERYSESIDTFQRALLEIPHSYWIGIPLLSDTRRHDQDKTSTRKVILDESIGHTCTSSNCSNRTSTGTGTTAAAADRYEAYTNATYDCYLHIGLCHHKLGQWQDAMVAFQSASRFLYIYVDANGDVDHNENRIDESSNGNMIRMVERRPSSKRWLRRSKDKCFASFLETNVHYNDDDGDKVSVDDGHPRPTGVVMEHFPNLPYHWKEHWEHWEQVLQWEKTGDVMLKKVFLARSSSFDFLVDNGEGMVHDNGCQARDHHQRSGSTRSDRNAGTAATEPATFLKKAEVAATLAAQAEAARQDYELAVSLYRAEIYQAPHSPDLARLLRKQAMAGVLEYYHYYYYKYYQNDISTMPSKLTSGVTGEIHTPTPLLLPPIVRNEKRNVNGASEFAATLEEGFCNVPPSSFLLSADNDNVNNNKNGGRLYVSSRHIQRLCQTFLQGEAVFAPQDTTSKKESRPILDYRRAVEYYNATVGMSQLYRRQLVKQEKRQTTVRSQKQLKIQEKGQLQGQLSNDYQYQHGLWLKSLQESEEALQDEFRMLVDSYRGSYGNGNASFVQNDHAFQWPLLFPPTRTATAFQAILYWLDEQYELIDHQVRIWEEYVTTPDTTDPSIGNGNCTAADDDRCVGSATDVGTTTTPFVTGHRSNEEIVPPDTTAPPQTAAQTRREKVVQIVNRFMSTKNGVKIKKMGMNDVKGGDLTDAQAEQTTATATPVAKDKKKKRNNRTNKDKQKQGQAQQTVNEENETEMLTSPGLQSQFRKYAFWTSSPNIIDGRHFHPENMNNDEKLQQVPLSFTTTTTTGSLINDPTAHTQNTPLLLWFIGIAAVIFSIMCLALMISLLLARMTNIENTCIETNASRKGKAKDANKGSNEPIEEKNQTTQDEGGKSVQVPIPKMNNICTKQMTYQQIQNKKRSDVVVPVSEDVSANAASDATGLATSTTLSTSVFSAPRDIDLNKDEHAPNFFGYGPCSIRLAEARNKATNCVVLLDQLERDLLAVASTTTDDASITSFPSASMPAVDDIQSKVKLTMLQQLVRARSHVLKSLAATEENFLQMLVGNMSERVVAAFDGENVIDDGLDCVDSADKSCESDLDEKDRQDYHHLHSLLVQYGKIHADTSDFATKVLSKAKDIRPPKHDHPKMFT